MMRFCVILLTVCLVPVVYLASDAAPPTDRPAAARWRTDFDEALA
jgi:hypothetical protein